jgi:hypothetical protein
MVHLKNFIRSMLRSRGLDIVRVAGSSGQELPLTDHVADQLLFVGQSGIPAVAIPLELLGWDNGFTLHPEGWNPYLATAREYLAGCALTYEESSLCAYYTRFTPETAAGYLCPELPADGELAGIQAAAYILPWSTQTPEERKQTRQKQNREEEALAAFPLSKKSGATGINKMGPVSLEKGRLEFQRLATLADSIKAKGYQRTRVMDVEAVALRHRGEQRYILASGLHRSAVLAALGYTSIPVVLKPRVVIDLDLILAGPAVRRGHWKAEEAAIYLDYLFTEKGGVRARALGLA